jgi:hypothetical protein
MSNLQKNVINNMLERISQVEKSFQNKALFRAMKLLNFPTSRIRKAIIAANDLKVRELAGKDVSVTSLYNALNTKEQARTTENARQAISKAVGIEPALFWQEDEIEDIAA